MARILGGGPPANESEITVIRELRDKAPDDWLVLHNIEIPVRGDKYEIDLAVVTGHSICLIDVKGTRGRIQVAGRKWYPERREPYHSPVAKLRGHARTLKGQLERSRATLSGVYVDALVVLTADDAVLADPSNRPDADAHDVTTLPHLIHTLSDVSRVRTGMIRDIQPYQNAIVEALNGVVRRPTGPRRFGNWAVKERLGGTEEVVEYRAVNATTPTSDTVLLRVYRADPFQEEAQRAAEKVAIANAYEVLAKMPSHECIVGRRDFFPVEDESRFVLVLDDVLGRSLHLCLDDRREPLSADTKLRVITDILRGLAHAHRYRVLHRALSPATVMVTGGGRALLTGFDYARPEDPRGHTVLDRLAEALDPAYVAPECQSRAQMMSRASDVYAAGVIAFRLLTGELPFATSAEQFSRGSVLPAQSMTDAGVPPELAELLQRLCALKPSDRPTAVEALERLRRALGGGAGGGRGKVPGRRTGGGSGDGPDCKNLPDGYQLTRKYTIRRKLGSGSFSVVYQVYDNLAGADRVLKIVMRDRESVVDRLRHEYQILLGLGPHPHVVAARDADYLAGSEYAYLVFDYVEGQDVGELTKGRPLGPSDVVKLGIDVADGLIHLHEHGVYHCDIKPSNLLRTDQGCMIIDFNVAAPVDSSMSKAGGTARYAPPDTAPGPPTPADLADRDVYGLGLTLYQLLVGSWPFSSVQPALGEPPADPRGMSSLPDFSDALVETVLKAIAPLRGDRFGSAAEFLKALRAIGPVYRPRHPEPEPEPLSQPAFNGVNPFVAHLRTLFSQSTSSNAGTRGHDPFKLYVHTALDKQLIRPVLAGAYQLVVITGNAGDGKTAFLEELTVQAGKKNGGVPEGSRLNGADIRLRDGRLLRTNHDGSQDEGDIANDQVLLDFFAPFAGAAPAVDSGETRLIAINEGRLVDFLSAHGERFGWLAEAVREGLRGGKAAEGVAVVNLNRRSVVADENDQDRSIFDRVLIRMTDPHFWAACDSCELAKTCYAPHNARTLAHPDAGPKVSRRLKELYTLTHLRGKLHITLRDLRSALAYMLTSGRGCDEIHELYRGDNAEAILSSFYFNSWAGTPDSRDRLLRQLREVDVATVPDPALDRQIDYLGPDAGQAVMTIDEAERGTYDVRLLRKLFERLPRGSAPTAAQVRSHQRYLASARRRFFFECVDDRRARRLLPYRSAESFLALLDRPESAADHLEAVIEAINRGEGLPDPGRLGDVLALQVRHVPGGTIRSYRLLDAGKLSLSVAATAGSPYVEGQPDGLVLTYHGAAGHAARLDIRLDLYELLHRLRGGYLPGIADQQGLYLGLTIFKNELAAAPYQEVLLAAGGRELHRISREPDGRLVMRPVPGSFAEGDL
ncbi:protein kinase [Microbispora sp. NPDC049125]|uniref:methylation-associated defense system protein kinase MAD6 n=1 Tax=Microbispora sp. NPDC049125 TaxID=3154929 RepID=UPI003465FB7B